MGCGDMTWDILAPYFPLGVAGHGVVAFNLTKTWRAGKANNQAQ